MKVCRKQRTKYSNQDENVSEGGGRGEEEKDKKEEREREEKKGIKEERKKG
jgi:hypothetical protein